MSLKRVLSVFSDCRSDSSSFCMCDSVAECSRSVEVYLDYVCACKISLLCNHRVRSCLPVLDFALSLLHCDPHILLALFDTSQFLLELILQLL